jgi:hypothetical protein
MSIHLDNIQHLAALAVFWIYIYIFNVIEVLDRSQQLVLLTSKFSAYITV